MEEEIFLYDERSWRKQVISMIRPGKTYRMNSRINKQGKTYDEEELYWNLKCLRFYPHFVEFEDQHGRSRTFKYSEVYFMVMEMRRREK